MFKTLPQHNVFRFRTLHFVYVWKYYICWSPAWNEKNTMEKVWFVNVVFTYGLGLNESDLSSAADIDNTEASSFITSDSAPVRPSVGMKRPRANLICTTANKCPRRQGEPECSQCLHQLAENKELREANALLTEHLAQSREAAADVE